MGSSRSLWLLALCPLALGTCILVVPMPHGGTFGGNLLEHWFRDVEAGYAQPAERRQVGDEPESAGRVGHARFAGELGFEANAVGAKWSVGTAGMRLAWRDESSGLLWGEPEVLELVIYGLGWQDVAEAVKHCSAVSPPGYWSLPTSSEFAQARAADIADHVPDMQGRWLAQLISDRVVLPAIAGFGQSDDPVVFVRCVARGQKAR